jgi:hypothetical protein
VLYLKRTKCDLFFINKEIINFQENSIASWTSYRGGHLAVFLSALSIKNNLVQDSTWTIAVEALASCQPSDTFRPSLTRPQADRKSHTACGREQWLPKAQQF